MERKITVGYWYIVGGPAGATVTVKGEVNPCCTVPEGGQGSFFAQAPVVIVSDEAITLSQVVNFKCAPVKRWLLGLGRGVQTLPAGYIQCDFLESTGTQYIVHDWQAFYNTPDIFDRGYAVTAQHMVESRYKYPLGIGWSNGTCSLTGPMYDSSTYNRAYFLTQAVYFSGISMLSKITTKMNYKNSKVVEFSAEDYYQKKDLTEQTLHGLQYGETNGGFGLFISAWQGNSLYPDSALACRIWNVKFTEGDKVVHVVSPAVDVDGKPCMYDKMLKKAFYNKGSGSFIVGMTLAQALKLSTLPATGGTLTVSLPWEAQLVITGVPAALQVAADKGWMITVQYRDPEADNAVYNKYAECVTVADMQAVNADYKNDLTKDGEWIYPLPELINSAWAFSRSDNLVSFDADLEKLTYGLSMFRNMPKMEKFKGSLKALMNGQEMFCYSYSFTDFDSTLERLDEGIYMFTGCQLNKESALNVLYSVPSYTDRKHNLYLGIHVDHKTDEEVLAAIADAETKGWNVGVQWNGTATAQTASTFGLRKPPVYAKLGTVERPDGTSEQILDWGHYVTDWEANGYREFGSVEEAKEYFNIIDEA